MLTAEITGDTHPKKVVLVSDDGEAENARLQEALEQWEFIELAATLKDTKVDGEGNLRLEIPTDEIGEVMDLVEGEFFGSDAWNKLTAMREDAIAQAEAKLGD